MWVIGGLTSRKRIGDLKKKKVSNEKKVVKTATERGKWGREQGVKYAQKNNFFYE